MISNMEQTPDVKKKIEQAREFWKASEKMLDTTKRSDGWWTEPDPVRVDVHSGEDCFA